MDSKTLQAARAALVVAVSWTLACGEPVVETPPEQQTGEPRAEAVPPAVPAAEPEQAPNDPESTRTRDFRNEVTARFLGGVQREVTPLEVAQVKAATVLVRTPRGSGSAFLFHREADGSCLLATNHHVVQGFEEFGSVVEAVLDSGSPREERMEARVVAMDPDADLAVLKIAPPSRRHEPLSLAVDDTVFETQSVIVAGFPFGEILSRSGLPAPTIGKGSISSLRYDDRGELFRVQLDADVNPGNSGGPVVSGGGQVLGIAVEALSTTNISFMVPVSKLHNLLNGYLVDLRYEVEGATRDKIVTISFETRDPMARISRLGLNLLASETDLPTGASAEALPRAGREISGATPSGESTTLRVRLGRQQGRAVFLQPWLENPRGGRNFAPFRVSLLDTGKQSGELSWSAEVEQAWGDDEPKWLEGGSVPLAGDWLEPDPQEDPFNADREEISEAVALTTFTPKNSSRVGDATASLLLKEAKTVLPDLVWSEDGSAFFVLTKLGVLHRVALDGFRETHRLRLFEDASAMVRSALGLVVAVPGSQIVRVIAEDDLRLLRMIRVPGVSQLASSPRLKVAYAADRGNASEIAVLDLQRKRVAETYVAREVWQQVRHSAGRNPFPSSLHDFNRPTASPDGKYLFVQSGRSVHRFRIRGTRLEYEEAGPSLGAGRIEISPDSKYLTIAGVLTSNPIKNHPRLRPNSLPIYRLENLLEPVRIVEVGPHPSALGFDVARGRLLATSSSTPLILLGTRSQPAQKYDLPIVRGARIQQILPHPTAPGALILTQLGLWWVSWA